MPRTDGPEERRKLWTGVGDGFSRAVDLVTATAVWAGIGYLIDRWLGSWPIAFAVGAVIGNLAGVYVLYRRSVEETGDRAEVAGAGVSRGWPKRAVPAAGGAATTRREGEDDDQA